MVNTNTQDIYVSLVLTSLFINHVQSGVIHGKPKFYCLNLLFLLSWRASSAIFIPLLVQVQYIYIYIYIYSNLDRSVCIFLIIIIIIIMVERRMWIFLQRKFRTFHDGKFKTFLVLKAGIKFLLKIKAVMNL